MLVLRRCVCQAIALNARLHMKVVYRSFSSCLLPVVRVHQLLNALEPKDPYFKGQRGGMEAPTRAPNY